jgi:hypothetical protein
LNGYRLFPNYDFTVSGEELILTAGLLKANDVLMISEFTNSIVPEAMAFRIFQDMRGVQATYRITTDTTTYTTQAVAITDDVIYVNNANALVEPNIEGNIWGVLTIGAERIMYRVRDTEAGTVSGLLRGTAGTAIAEHADGAIVYNLSRGNLLPEEYQNYIVSNITNPLVSGVNLGDGAEVNGVWTGTTVFTATEIDLTLQGSLEVYLGGILQTTGYTITGTNPAEITFDRAPAAGVAVTMLVRQGVTWYAPGNGTPSNGEPLQITETQAARFLRGL